MINREIQFAVVREDAALELNQLKCFKNPKILITGSGGCTLFSILAENPSADITIYDFNSAQLELIQTKKDELNKAGFDPHKWSIGMVNPQSLIDSGNFESLFRNFRNFLFDFVANYDFWYLLFNSESQEARNELIENIFSHKYWNVAFELFFSDIILETMFTKSATQHTPNGFYASYFKNRLEQGLRRQDIGQNFFLHHIFLGHYLDKFNSLPVYLSNPPKNLDFKMFQGNLLDIPSFDSFDVISFSNIFDWMSESEIAQIAKKVSDEAKPGCKVMWRQLGHKKKLNEFFDQIFSFEELEDAELDQTEKSIFYCKAYIGTKRRN